MAAKKQLTRSSGLPITIYQPPGLVGLYDLLPKHLCVLETCMEMMEWHLSLNDWICITCILYCCDGYRAFVRVSRCITSVVPLLFGQQTSMCGTSWLAVRLSETSHIQFGVPQDSVLEPLFVLYTADVRQIVRHYGLNVHEYTDDTQVYMYTSCRSKDTPVVCRDICCCIELLESWMQLNRLQLNASKTELMWCSPSRRHHSLPAEQPLINQVTLPTVGKVYNLGAYLDSELSVRAHITARELLLWNSAVATRPPTMFYRRCFFIIIWFSVSLPVQSITWKETSPKWHVCVERNIKPYSLFTYSSACLSLL